MNHITKIRKPVIFATVAAIGCLVAAILAEPLFVKRESIVLPNAPQQPGPYFCFCIDDSGSMSGQKRMDVKAAAKEFVNPRDLTNEKFGIVVFSSGSQVFLPMSHDKNQVLTILDSYSDGGGTYFTQALNDSANQLANDSEIASEQTEYKDAVEKVNERINAVNEQIKQGRVKGKTIDTLPTTVSIPKIILFFTDGQNGDQQQALQKAAEIREKGIKIYAIATQDGDKNYLTQIAGDSSQVYMTSDANIKDAFKQIEQKISADISKSSADFLGSAGEGVTKNDNGELVIPVGNSRSYQMFQSIVWSALLCIGMAILIMLTQNWMLRKPLFEPVQFVTLTIGSVAGGIVAGFIGDNVFQFIPIDFIGRLIGLILLGSILAVGMSFYIANLDRKWAFIGGAAGGFLGAIGFAMSSAMIGNTSGRIFGAIIIGACIGAMIGWVEMVFRNAWLTVIYDPRKTALVNLGTQLVTVGGSNRDMIFINGAEPSVGAFQMTGDKITYKTKNGAQTVNPGDRITVNGVELVVCSKDVLFAASKFYPMRMCKVPR